MRSAQPSFFHEWVRSPVAILFPVDIVFRDLLESLTGGVFADLASLVELTEPYQTS